MAPKTISMEKTMKEIVFISYTRSDSNFAQVLYEKLVQKNIEVWFDKNDINPGKDWNNEINKALNNCTSMIILLNENSYSSNYIRNEIDHAINSKKMMHRILPVFFSMNNRIEFEKLPWILKHFKVLVLDDEDEINKNIRKVINEFEKMIKGNI
jgi:hypothetical protein